MEDEGVNEDALALKGYWVDEVMSEPFIKDKALQLAWGSSSTSGASSFLWQDNGQVGYRFFTANKPIQVDFDLTRFSNNSSSKKGQFQLRTYDVSGTQTTIGFIMDNYATGTMPSIRGLAYLGTGSAATSGTYAFTLATGSAVTQAGTHSYYTAYENTTGLVYWGWDVGLTSETNFYFDPTANSYIGAANQVAINEIDFLNNRNSSTTSGSQNLDNIAFYAYDVPAPGAVALLGLAGIVARRRRN